MIRRGRANTLIVAKLDRLSRSLRDVCALVGDYFTEERYHLLSCCGMVNTHSAAGRMLMINLANFKNFYEFERAMIQCRAASEGAPRGGAESSRSRRATGDGRARARAWGGLVSGAGVYSFGVASRCGLTIPHL
jgi:DNA invertase Pin-like site-specific DNA recombinase